jgi:hydroxymethylpyrimidine pyrophosphatase-like HAD family hydrolase
MKKKRNVAFDFDGVIAKYDGFKGADVVGEPRKEVVEAIRQLKRDGHTIIIYSTRSNELLKNYCDKHNIPVDYINENPNFDTGNKGKPAAGVYVEDRAVLYKGQDTEDLIQEILNFKAYWE